MLLKSTAAGGLAASLLLHIAMAQPLTVSTLAGSVSSYVTVLAPGTAEFDRALSTLVSPAVAAGLAPAFPYSVIIENTSKEDLRGVGVTFWEKGVPPLHRQSYRVAMLDPAQKPRKPGYYWLFVASGALNATAGLNSVSLPAGISVSSLVADLERSPLFATVEWVMDKKGQIIGPDTLNSAAELVARQHGRAALAQSLKSSADPKAALEAAAAVQPGPGVDLFNRDHYNEQIKRDARMMLEGLKAGNVGEVGRYVSRVSREITITKP